MSRSAFTASRLALPFVLPPARPFLKWAGGKTQLVPQLDRLLPLQVKRGQLSAYVEPFLGGGAFFFYVVQRYAFREFYLQDINPQLIHAYQCVRDAVEAVIGALADIERHYKALTLPKQEDFFYQLRHDYNAAGHDQPSVAQTARLIFLNHTCFNGLFRLNAQGHFNVPFGGYVNPTLCDADNLRAVAAVLQRVSLRVGDFETCMPVVSNQTFIYLDPPYRPISKTASFNTYASARFGDAEQRRLAGFCRALDSAGAYWMLSNSDPHNTNPADDFFDQLYAGFQIQRVLATRAINAHGAKRGVINELVITNYMP